MNEVTISSKYQIVIPKDIRKQLSLKPGQRVRAICIGERIELVPIRDLKETKGFLKGISTQVKREPDRA
ncbi:MAG: AbrB/MazE/SpoVT family DNA-binding domain-containing protein [Pseudomonadales bacterium]|jgi:AbrB family looped-hinge helix DNA binding protein|nr:AbrB/MazE/SpoVT family DNA-binding domain-containing protein [Pseudomonadales bacterium]MDP7357423.1 AbrB/MazE/SpoVT family DNA-binding domain-containing protein [Pseudomonadales bacterium]MDP7595505.1 AbrB/MazE/SpoVT family DNA-binding domain-containing protein [Pseudomonadales bacterium]HJN52457.1 AbrB/MazE/SpoVT family DNA-binding domain-containing protein [Pseudomonadales bacterium]|tara:strand:+ start:1503 stop:1709 length:207 start_codon:yes stop_codon:yes gene_type:complete